MIGGKIVSAAQRRFSIVQAVLHGLGFMLVVGFVLVMGPAQASGSGSPKDTTPSGNFEKADQIFRSFKGYCPSKGEWVNRARSNARNLSSLIRALREDDACRSLSASLNELDTLDRILDRESLDYDEISYERRKRERYELLMILNEEQSSATPDAAVIDSLEASLRNVQVEIGKLEETNEFKQRSERRLALTQQTVDSVKAILSLSVSQQECLSAQPRIFEGLVSLAGSIGAVAVTGGASLGIAAGVELLGAAIEASREYALVRKENQVNEATIHESFACVLEAMGNQWCGVDEGIELYDLYRDAVNRRGRDRFYDGIHFIRRELPVFLDWLDEVRSGARPNNFGEANRFKEIEAKEAALEAFRLNASAAVEQQKELIPEGNSEADQRLQFELMRDAIRDIINSGGGTAGNVIVGNPVFAPTPSDELPWILAGMDEAPSFENADGQELTDDFFSQSATVFARGEKYPEVEYPIDPETIIAQTEVVYRRAREFLDRERGIVRDIDPRSVLWAAEDNVTPRDGGRGISPQVALQRLKTFVGGMAQREMSANQRFYYEDIVNRLEKIDSILGSALTSGPVEVGDNEGERRNDDESSLPEPTPEDRLAQNALDAIYAEAKLENGRTFFENRLRRVIRFELFEETRNPTGDSRIDKRTSTKLLAALDILDEFETLDGGSPAFLKSDLSSAKINISTQTQAFSRVFARNLSQALTFYHKQASLDEDHVTAYRDICLHLLAVPDWTAKELQDVPLELCEGVQKPSDFGGEPSPLLSRDSFFERYSMGRACQYRNFARQEKILEQFGSAPRAPSFTTNLN